MDFEEITCYKCNVKLSLSRVKLNYLGFQFSHEFPRCPECGQLYISEEFVMDKIKQVEITLEDK